MDLQDLTAISPIDGRYRKKTSQLAEYFSEYALIKYRVYVEVQYFIALSDIPLPQLAGFTDENKSQINQIHLNFSIADAQRIKEIEQTTNHDVKAVEYFIKEKMDAAGLGNFKEFVHFGLTSQDINNTAQPVSIRDFLNDIYYPKIQVVIDALTKLANEWKEQPLLARTHGQPASPTVLGKEIMVFVQRIKSQLQQLKQIPISAKFGGATGNFNAHIVAYPTIDWHRFGDLFIEKYIGGLQRSFPTTQIEHYDNQSALFDACKRINTILIDFCRDIWTYISMDYFKQQIKAGEVGSSAMPHKVNPIDFENAEGNLGIANSLFDHLSSKLPISRLQRDLTDSTVSRNIGVPFAHCIISFLSIEKGLSKLLLNADKINDDLNNNWAVVAEAIQNILRREAYPKPYEALKELTRTNTGIKESTIKEFIQSLNVSDEIKAEMTAITPFNYIGK